jgi:hypothetical protein
MGSGTGPTTVITGDFNKDGNADVAIGNSSGNTVRILLSNGQSSRTFGYDMLPAVAAGSSPAAITTGDFNGDGLLDLAATESGVDVIQLFSGDGTGALTAQHSFAVDGEQTQASGEGTNWLAGPTPSELVSGDFNNDKKTDITDVNLATRNIGLFYGDGDFGIAQLHPSAGTLRLPTGLGTGDFNSDKKLDVVTANYVNNSLAFKLNNGRGNFTNFSVPTGSSPMGVTVADFNGDKVPDVATASQLNGVVQIYACLNKTVIKKVKRKKVKTVVFAPKLLKSIAVGDIPQAIASGDVTGDGKPDVVIASTSTDTIDIVPNLGKGKFGKKISFKMPAGSSPNALAIADVNKDRNQDIVIIEGATEKIATLISFGHGAFVLKETDPISNRSAVAAGVPVISGVLRVGETVTTDNGSWSTDFPTPTGFKYQWSKSPTVAGRYTDISSAQSSSYTLVAGDLGQHLKLCVTASVGGVDSAPNCSIPSNAVLTAF